MSFYTDTDAAERASARGKVSKAAHDGQAPSALWPASELEWAFAGDEDSLTELERIAEQKRQAEVERNRLSARRLEVDETAKQLLRKWADDEERERRARAYAEAERIVAEREAAE